MSVLPAATPAAGTVIDIVVLVVVLPAVPTFLMKARPGPGPVQLGFERSAGHDALAPLHVSTTSQVLAVARQTAPAGWTASPGHAALAPVQVSLASQAPLAGRQTAPAGSSASA